MCPDLHPEMEAFLEQRQEASILPTHTLSPEEARRQSKDLYASTTDPEPVGEVEYFDIQTQDGNLRLRAYIPDRDRPYPVLIWFHGGGFVVGGLDTADATCRALTAETGRLVISVDYRLAPEHPFPAAVRDCYQATEWVSSYIPSLGGDSDSISIGGSSAGGTLAAVTALMARDRDGPSLQAQILIYPMTNYDKPMDSYEEYKDGYGLPVETVRWYKNQYISRDIDGYHPYAFPLSGISLHDLPPAIVVTAEFDPLRDEAIEYMRSLSNTGISVFHHEYEGFIHGFFGLLNDPSLPEAREAVRKVASDLSNITDQ